GRRSQESAGQGGPIAMSAQSTQGMIDVTAAFVRLYVFLTQYLDRCVDRAKAESFPEHELQAHLASTREFGGYPESEPGRANEGRTGVSANSHSRGSPLERRSRKERRVE